MVTAAFTNFNRTDLLFEAIEPFLNDDRISEIVISDDNSDEQVFFNVVLKYTSTPKVKIFRNDVTLDCYRNKRQAVSLATNEWVLLLDSDNIFSKEFIDVIFDNEPLSSHTILAPSFAKPHFDFRSLDGIAITKVNVSSYINHGNCSTMLNAMNYFVNRDEYLHVWDGSVDPVTSDSLFQNYNWLKAGNSIYVVPGLEYEHRVHSGSHYQQNVRRTPSGFHDSIIEKLKAMK